MNHCTNVQEAVEVYRAVMGEIGAALLQAGSMLLAPSNREELGPGGKLEDNAFMVVDAMATFGSEHLSTLADPQHRDLFLQQVCLRFICRQPLHASQYICMICCHSEEG